MLWLLKFLPGIGSIFDGLFTYLNKKQDIDLEKYKVDGQVKTELIEADVSIIQARSQLVAAMKDDPTMRWGRRFFIYPVGVWFSLIVYDSCFRELLPVWMTWRILALPANLEYVIYAVVAFLFALAWRGPR